MAPPTPITIITGFLGSGKTTLILNLLPQLPPTYKVALLKNEFGDVAIDSKLATSKSISGVQELLNGCICCNLVGQLGDALSTLRSDIKPDRIIIETSGSAFPATLALEVNRLAKESGGLDYVLDGVVSVIDVENWKGYEDTSYTAKMQARYTDLIVFNKWEEVSERRFEECEDRVLDLEIDVPRIRSVKGKVDKGVLLGLDSALAKKAGELEALQGQNGHDHGHSHEHEHDHQSEVEVLSVQLNRENGDHAVEGVDVKTLDQFLRKAPKEDLYRIKAVFNATSAPIPSDGVTTGQFQNGSRSYILNWAFGRWTFTDIGEPTAGAELEMTIVTARDEATRWAKKIEAGGLLKLEKNSGNLTVKKVA